MKNPEQNTAISSVVRDSTSRLGQACSRFAHGVISKEEFHGEILLCADSLRSYADIIKETKSSISSKVHNVIK